MTLILSDVGATGPSGTITVGTTTTLAAGASATVTNSGTSTAAIFNFGVPRGATGATGPNTVTTSTTTNITGILKGNGSAVSAATAGTDYLVPTGNGSGLTGITSGQVSGLGTAALVNTGTTAGTLLLLGVDGRITTTGTGAFINTSGEDALISTSGNNASISTGGNAASIYTSGLGAEIYTAGDNASILTLGGSANIYTAGGGYIETSSTFKITGGGFATTLSGTQTADRAISFPDASGTLAIGSGTGGAIVSADITDASSGATDESVVNVVAKFGANGELFGATFYANSVSVQPGGSLILTSTNSGGLVVLTGESATSARSIAFPDASGTLALTTSNVATATALQTARTINGVSFDGTADITVTAAGSTLTDAVPISRGGTGSTSNTSVGALLYGTGTVTRANLTGSISATMAVLTQTGNGSTSAAPAWTSTTGTGNIVRATSPTIVTPTIAAINGGTAANDDLTLQGTTNATRTTSYVLIQPNGGLVQIGAGTPVTDSALPLQLSTAGSGTETNIGINKNGAYGFLLGFKNGTGTSFANYLGGYMRNVTTDPFSIIVNNVQIATTWTSNGSVGLGGTVTHTGTLAGAHLIIDGVTGRSTFNGPAKLRGYTFATLPTGSIGDKAYITDGAAVPIYRANAAGGGSTVTEVFYDGSNWINS